MRTTHKLAFPSHLFQLLPFNFLSRSMVKHSDPSPAPPRPPSRPRLIRRHFLVKAFVAGNKAKCLPDTSVSSLCSLLGAPCSYDPARSFREGTSHTLFYGCIVLEIPSTVYLQVKKKKCAAVRSASDKTSLHQTTKRDENPSFPFLKKQQKKPNIFVRACM